MPYDGAGTFTRVYDWTTDRDAGVLIRADRSDEELDGMATALSTALLKDGTQTPTANIPLGGYKLTGLGAPTAVGDAATKAYVDAAVTPAPRVTARVATTANITIATALNNGDTLDGISLVTDDIILVKNQTNAYENGIYIVAASPGRSGDFDTYDEHVGAICAVTAGTAGADTLWVCMANTGGVLDTDDIIWAPSGSTLPTPLTLALGGTETSLVDPDADRILFWDDGAGSMAWLSASTGLTLTGTALTVSTTLAGMTLTSPVLNGTLSGTAFLDDDAMAADSAIAAASQQSIKAYVDAQIGAISGFAKIATGSFTGDGSTSKAITGVGFLPTVVAVFAVANPSSGNHWIKTAAMASTTAAKIDGFSTSTDAIIALGADGFTVDDGGADLHPNKSGNTYYWIALG